MEHMSPTECPACHGKRLRPESLAVKVNGISIADFTALPVSRALEVARKIKLTGREEIIAGRIVHEIVERLQFLDAVGLGYISLARSAATLSGGEGQRIRLATQIGSKLRGVLYVLDEPSIGLHHRDNGRLLKALEELRDLGNTVLVGEHDEETNRRSGARPVPIPQPTPESSRRFAIFMQCCRKPASAATSRGASPSTCPADAAKPARAKASGALK